MAGGRTAAAIAVSDAFAQAVIASAIGVIFTVAARLIDKYIPDPDDRHPLPPTVGTGRRQHGTAPDAGTDVGYKAGQQRAESLPDEESPP